ncbi:MULTISPECIES: prepilin-type N-terminal cleavage/methylation domain-containing protein [unclassified Psychrobacter]|uniref:prepilin-type N-terminal cleavage/methylation domain-containing protein n=1 Tax=unclassified Psychrobacter TaxID=196806 RepID=UPI003F461FB5
MTQQLQKGFTVVEMMIVVVIIGLLAAIATPIYTQYISKAKQSACLSEVKGYSNKVFYTLKDENNTSVSIIAPVISACQSITDATGWTLETQQKIIATAKQPSNVRIECDIPNGSPCRILP